MVFLKENIYMLDMLIQRLKKKEIIRTLQGTHDLEETRVYPPNFSNFYTNTHVQMTQYCRKLKAQKKKYERTKVVMYARMNAILDKIMLIFSQTELGQKCPNDIYSTIKEFIFPHDSQNRHVNRNCKYSCHICDTALRTI